MNYSIIIPHKNSIDVLPRLLKSIPIRDDLEILVVDDNSSEEEKAKLELLRDEYSFVLLENTGKRGAGSSRNVGLKVAKGKWLIFADADDYFTSIFCDELDININNLNDVIFYRVSSVDSVTYKESHRHLFFNALVNDYLSNNKRDILYKYSSPWGKFFNREFINEHDLKFSEVVAGNDMYFSCRAGVLLRSFEVIDREVYTVTLREGSIVNTVNSEYFESRFDETVKINNMLVSSGLGRYQYSVLYFIANAFRFSKKTSFYVLKEIVRNRSNLLIGIDKVFTYKKVLIDRENRIKK